MDVQVRRREADYELTVDGEHAGRLEIIESAGVVDLVHTYVDDGFAGKGLAGRLVQAVLDDVRARGLTAVVTCEYAQGWLAKHPEYQDVAQPRG